MSKRLTAISSNAWNVLKKPDGTIGSIHDVHQWNTSVARCVVCESALPFLWSCDMIGQCCATSEDLPNTISQIVLGCEATVASSTGAKTCPPVTAFSKRTHTHTPTHRITNLANVTWCINSSRGLAIPWGLACAINASLVLGIFRHQ